MRWGQMLGKYVSDSGKVNYLAWQNESAELDAYLEGLANMPPRENWPLPQKLAYWINAYNALTIQLILKNYPIGSIRDIKKPWSRIVFKTNDKSYSLHFIEHEILRKLGEPRIHFAIIFHSVLPIRVFSKKHSYAVGSNAWQICLRFWKSKLFGLAK